MRRLLAIAIQTHAPSSAGSCRTRGPACVPISCAAFWRAPFREKEPRAPPAGGRRGISCAAITGGRLTERRNLARRRLAGAEGSHAPPGLAGALQREKPRAPPAGGRRGLVGLLAHTYTTCAVMSGLDKDRRSILTIMFVRDSCSKQLDSNRLAADVPDINTSESIGVFYCPNR
jgi:hypothetical protein